MPIPLGPSQRPRGRQGLVRPPSPRKEHLPVLGTSSGALTPPQAAATRLRTDCYPVCTPRAARLPLPSPRALPLRVPERRGQGLQALWGSSLVPSSSPTAQAWSCAVLPHGTPGRGPGGGGGGGVRQTHTHTPHMMDRPRAAWPGRPHGSKTSGQTLGRDRGTHGAFLGNLVLVWGQGGPSMVLQVRPQVGGSSGQGRCPSLPPPLRALLLRKPQVSAQTPAFPRGDPDLPANSSPEGAAIHRVGSPSEPEAPRSMRCLTSSLGGGSRNISAIIRPNLGEISENAALLRSSAQR